MFQKCLCKLLIKCPFFCDVADEPSMLEHKVFASQQTFQKNPVNSVPGSKVCLIYALFLDYFQIPTILMLADYQVSNIVCLPEFSHTGI